MPLFSCDHCGQPIDADETLAGSEVGCPGCFTAIRVPALTPYQPYQPPSSLRGWNTAPQPTPTPSSDKWRTKAPLLGTGVALALCLLKKISEPVSSLDQALGNTGSAVILGGAVGYAIAAGIFAVLLALVIAGIAAACRKSFGAVFARSYGIGVVLLALLMFAASALNSRSHRTPPPQQSQANQSQANQKTLEELNSLQRDMQNMQEGVTPAEGTPSSKTATPPANDTDEMGKLVLVTRQYFDEIAAHQKAYLAGLAKIEFSRLLNTARVQADTDFSKSDAMLAQAQALMKEQAAKMRESLASLPAKIRASNMSPTFKENNARSAEQGMPKAMISFDENWALEESILNQFVIIFDLLKNRRGHWHTVGDQFFFDDGSDLAAFNATMNKIKEASARQNEIKQRGQKGTEKMFDDLRTVLPK